ncbi:UNVERIFIED_CONTAM: hypothetical protein GTU68_061499 [Idotea baltica]|nr:hypothetical protein [Idotea baltica]
MKIITISGASGSGKSTLADYICSRISTSLLLSIDRYYLSKKEQIAKCGFFNFDYPSALDVKLMKENVEKLKQNGTTSVPIYDFTISERAGYETVTAKNHIIIDGLFAGALLSDISDINIFVDVDLDLALLRRIDRDMNERGRTLASIKDQYMNDVRPAYFEHIEHIKKTADIVLTNNQSTDQLLLNAKKIMHLIV